MPSKWRYLCCLCDIADDKRSYSARYEFSSRIKTNRSGKSGKNTWARRSLLDHDHIELNDFPSEQGQYQMQANEDSFQGRLQDNFTPRKRPPVHGIFENSQDESSTSKTTFPWMDERFVPSSRNGTRLGISSVQMNAKRSESAEQNKARKDIKPSVFTPYVKSQSFTDGQGRQFDRNLSQQVINSSNANKNFQNVKNGHVLRNNLNTAPVETKNSRKPVRLGIFSNYRDKPVVLRAPSSDVGVRQVTSTNSQIRQDKIPKLEDYAGKRSSPFVQSRPTIMDIFSGSDLTDAAQRENEADVSYTSEIIFRKQPSEHSGSEVSLKRSEGPRMFSPTSNKYERLKPERSKSDNSKIEKPKTKGKYSNLSSDSMYGYVPKVVQNVHASNALEGTKIDDFFMQRMHERELEDFGTIDNAKKNSEEETVIVTSIVGSTENLNETSERDKMSNINELTGMQALEHVFDKNTSKSRFIDSKSTKRETTVAKTEEKTFNDSFKRGTKDETHLTDKTAVSSSNVNSKVNTTTSGSREHGFNERHKAAATRDNTEKKPNAIQKATTTSSNMEQKVIKAIHKDVSASGNAEKNAQAVNKVVETSSNIDGNIMDNDKYEDQVIMIDFPPNSDTDGTTPVIVRKTLPSKESGSDVSKRSSTSATSKITNREVLY